MTGSTTDPVRFGWDWRAVRMVLHLGWLVLATGLVLVGAGLMIGGAVGYALSWLMETAIGALEV